ncbi:MAG: LAGLIDADG family homing endonuclease [candidate division WWE3 bacterium]|nr:LAGLIDADG family homing endonuclease [candidate division WWE3 bacterium]
MVSADYIVGLVDGEGCFYINIFRDKRYPKARPIVQTHFYLKLVEDELPLLKKVQQSLGCGAIYLQRDKRDNHRQCYRFEINSQKDIHQCVLPFFEKHPLRSSKRKDFETFKKVALIVKEGKHFEDEGLKRIIELKSGMNSHRARRMRENRSSGGNAK